MRGCGHLPNGCTCPGCNTQNIIPVLVISIHLCFLLAVAAEGVVIPLDHDCAYNFKAYTLSQVDFSTYMMATVFHLFYVATCSAELFTVSASLDNSRQQIELEIPAVAEPLMSASTIAQMKQDHADDVAEAEKKELPIPLDLGLDRLSSVFAATRMRCTMTKKDSRTGQVKTSAKTKKIKISLPSGMTLKTDYFNIEDDSKTLSKNTHLVDIPVFLEDGTPVLDGHGNQLCDRVLVARWTCIVEGTEERLKLQETKAKIHRNKISKQIKNTKI